MASVYDTILDQVRDAVDALTLTPTPRVIRRKRFVPHQSDSAPLVIIFPLEEDELSEEDQTELTVPMMYPVGVGIVLSSPNLGSNTDIDTMLAYRQTIRRAIRSIHVISVQEAPCTNVTCDLRPAFDRAAFHASNKDVSAMIFNYTVQEPRIT